MANINAFRAIRTNGFIFEQEHKNQQLQQLLEKGSCTTDEQPAIFIYEQDTSLGSQTGVWVLTDVQDMEDGKIIIHEHTLAENEDKIRIQRENTGVEGSPILLTYQPVAAINRLIGTITSSYPPEAFYENQQYHRIWKVTAPDFIRQFREAFLKLDKVYLADGHHRLAAALQHHKKEKQWISTLYVSTEQIRISAFHRLVVPNEFLDEELLFKTLKQTFEVIHVSDNAPYLPDEPHHLGLFYAGNWYKLSLKPEREQLKDEPDVCILQEQVLKPLFDLQDPRNDTRLSSFGPDQGWPALLYELSAEPFSVAFTLYPMDIDQLIAQAEKKASLPPKSTWIEPKIPFGLLVYSSGVK